jgi:glycerate 2-kinase
LLKILDPKSEDRGAAQRRELLLGAYRAALQAADPEQAVARAIAVEGAGLTLRGSRGGSQDLQASIEIPRAGLRVAGLGKGALAMVAGALQALGSHVRGGVAVAPRRGEAVPDPKREAQLRALESHGVQLIESSHPLPDASSVRGAEALLESARTAASAGELFLVLLSGGASALAEKPAEPLSLEDLREVNRLLLASGAPIEEMNRVRKQVSQIKAGRLARAASPSLVFTLALSDVIGAPLHVIGGGPTLEESSGIREAMQVLETRGLFAKLPEAVRALLQSGLAREAAEMVGTQTKSGAPSNISLDDSLSRFFLVGDARMAAEAAQRELAGRGVRARLVDAALQGDAEAFARTLPARVSAIRTAMQPGVSGAAPCSLVCEIWAGELTVEVRGKGKGGRDQQLALAFALLLEGMPGVTLAALATDGMDGPADAAGAIVDGGTAQKIRAAGIDPARALLDNDAYPALEAAGALVVTGPSGTNVNDLFLLCVEA